MRAIDTETGTEWRADANDLPEIREQAADLEFRIEAQALELEFSRDLVSLREQQGWKDLITRLQAIEKDEVEKLRSERMDSYQLGRRQGMLSALRGMTKNRPLTQDEVDTAVANIRLWQQRLEQLRQLLA